MKLKKLLFHIKWLFKKRYQIVFSIDPANRENIVAMKHDKKYNKFKVIG